MSWLYEAGKGIANAGAAIATSCCLTALGSKVLTELDTRGSLSYTAANSIALSTLATGVYVATSSSISLPVKCCYALGSIVVNSVMGTIAGSGKRPASNTVTSNLVPINNGVSAGLLPVIIAVATVATTGVLTPVAIIGGVVGGGVAAYSWACLKAAEADKVQVKS